MFNFSVLAPYEGTPTRTWILEPYWDETDAPVTTASVAPAVPAGGWHTSAATVSFTATDGTFGAGVREIRRTVDMGAEQVTSGDSASTEIAGDGVHSVAYWAVDKVGNTEAARYLTVKVDRTPPVTTATRNQASLSIAATDNLSGVATVHYAINGGAPRPYAGPITLGPHVRTVRHWAIDNAGNVAEPDTVLVGQVLKAVVLPGRPAYAGSSITVGVELVDTAPDGGLAVTLESSHPAVLAPPTTLVVPAGQRTASVNVTLGRVATDTPVAITASVDGTSAKRSVLVLVPVPRSLAAAPSVVPSGGSLLLTVTLVSAAPPGGQSVSLRSLDAGVVALPESVTVAAGTLSKTIAVPVSTSSTDRTVLLVAEADGETALCPVAVRAIGVAGLSLSASQVAGGTTVDATLRLTRAAPAGGTRVAVRIVGDGASAPAEVVVPPDAFTATFPVATSPVRTESTVSVRAELAGSVRRAPLSIRAPRLAAVSIAPSRVRPGATATGTVTITGPAPEGGIDIVLTSLSGAASVPSTVRVPAGAVSATFVVSTQPTAAATTAIVKAVWNNDIKSANLTIAP